MEHASVYALFREVVSRHPDKAAFRYKKGEPWVDVSWGESEKLTSSVGRALMALGIGKGDKVGILSNTRLEWVLSDLGTTGAGGVTVGIYPSNLADAVAYIIDLCDVKVVICEDREQLDKILETRAQLPNLSAIVVMDGESDASTGVLSWADFLARAEGTSEADFEARSASVKPDDLAALVCTSGTTGNPKAAMITHDNLLFTSQSVMESLPVRGDFVTLLFLPLAHVFARTAVYTGLRAGVTTAFAQNLTTVGEDLRAVSPHYIASVPRIFEKVHEKIIGGVESAGGLKKTLFYWAVGVGREVSALKQQGKEPGGLLALRYSLATALVLKKIHAAMGGRLEWAISGASALNKNLAEFFHACGLLILEGIGMTENTSFSNVNRADHYKFGTVGPTGPGIEMRADSDGEILFKGRNVMQGYYKNPEATAEALGGDGWLRTGDIGEIDADGFLKITDRKKELIITAGGKNVAPQRIERIHREALLVSQVVAFGNDKKFISALITLDPEKMPDWAKDKGIAFESMADLAENDQVKAMVQAEIEKQNGQLASFEQIKKFVILPEDLSIEGGELTPTLKLKRKVIDKKYGALIDALYA